jgi:DNA helicase IV
MELAWKVLGKTPDMAAPRDGEAVEIIRTQTHEQSMKEISMILNSYLESSPRALVGVVCRYKTDADRVFEDLKRLGMETLRRHERDDFSFGPGAIVTNAHQVKGLEFSAIIAVNPAASQYRDTAEDRMLLHVVMTRAADRLWLVGHQTVAYGLENTR